MNKLKTIVKVLDEKLAEDIVVIDMSIDCPICDYFVIATANNERLLLALKDQKKEKIMGLKNYGLISQLFK